MIFPWTAVVAMDVRGIIAREGKLPWYLPSELQHFKRLTLGHPVIMGRKTFEAIGRPLPNRHNVILSRWKREDAAREIVTAQDATHHYVHDVTVLFDRYGQEEAMVIGGGIFFFTSTLLYEDGTDDCPCRYRRRHLFSTLGSN